MDFVIVSHSQLKKGDFPLRFDFCVIAKQRSCSQYFMTTCDCASDIAVILSSLVDVRYVKIIHIDDIDDEL